MSDEENDRFKMEQRLLVENLNHIPHTPSAWDQDMCDIDEDPDPHGKYVLYLLYLLRLICLCSCVREMWALTS